MFSRILCRGTASSTGWPGRGSLPRTKPVRALALGAATVSKYGGATDEGKGRLTHMCFGGDWAGMTSFPSENPTTFKQLPYNSQQCLWFGAHKIIVDYGTLSIC